jgi:epoxyqueuosine reductase
VRGRGGEGVIHPLTATPMTFADELKAQAQTAGFDLCGIAPADPSAYTEVYARWLAAGYHGAMQYLATPAARARRADPRGLFAGARSWISVACRYFTPDPPDPPAGRPSGKVARYARGAEDYHRVFDRRLHALAGWITAHAPRPCTVKVYCDTSAVLEREVAQRAGLGWIGKNTLLINPQQGSWLLLGELLTDLELGADPPAVTDHCGTCTRCIEACPTACILPERVLDATRCIAYLTIEQAGPIPDDLAPAVGDWAFGCDICQEVCPWNERFAVATDDPAWQPGAHAQADLEAWPALDDDAFRARFGRTALKRAGRAGLARNARTVLANKKNTGTS